MWLKNLESSISAKYQGYFGLLLWVSSGHNDVCELITRIMMDLHLHVDKNVLKVIRYIEFTFVMRNVISVQLKMVSTPP